MALTAMAVMDQVAAFGYGLAYEAVVRGFRPYEELLEEIVARIGRALPAGLSPASTRVLDAACGTGTLARRLARAGYDVVGIDGVARLVEIARATPIDPSGRRLTYRHLDLSREAIPSGDCYNVVVSLHTLYWHPDPAGFLAGCRRALTEGGHALFLTYAHAPRVVSTFRAVRARGGLADGIRALRWLVPTAAFEALRSGERRYLSPGEFHALLGGAGFRVLESARTFLGQISLLAWTSRV
ncbi:MAG: class I SAM-dependent methyltransferase [Candidatus Rokuibacteriota bacterium]